MILLPAIDIKDGTCVRLQKGDYQTAHKVAENPLETALSFQKAGAEWIHMVDLDGAKDQPEGRAGRRDPKHGNRGLLSAKRYFPGNFRISCGEEPALCGAGSRKVQRSDRRGNRREK